MSLEYKTEGKKIYFYWDGDLVKEIDKILVAKHLSSLMRALSYKEFVEEFQVLEKKMAISLAAKLLGRKAYLSEALQEKLRGRGLSRQAAEDAAKWAQLHGFIDDGVQIEKWIIKRIQKGYGLQWIAYEMKKKKMPLYFLEKNRTQFLKEEKKAATVLYEKLTRLHGVDPQGRLKVAMKMKRRGFIGNTCMLE